MSEQENLASPEQTPSTAVDSPLGINPFEEAFRASDSQPAEQQSDGSPVETVAGAEEGTAEGASPEIGAAETGTVTEQSFLSEEEQQQFDTNSPEYKAMQASFTRKMQALSDKEREIQTASSEDRLRQVEAQLAGDQQQQVSNAMLPDMFDGLKISALPEELGEYQEAFLGMVKEVAQHVIGKSNDYAMAEVQQQQQVQARKSLQEQAESFRANPEFADYTSYYPKMKEIADQSPALLQRPNGLEAVYRLAKAEMGEKTPAPQAGQSPDYARGVKDALNNLQTKRQAAIPQTPQQGVETRPAVAQYASLEDAVRGEGERAVAAARNR